MFIVIMLCVWVWFKKTSQDVFHLSLYIYSYISIALFSFKWIDEQKYQLVRVPITIQRNIKPVVSLYLTGAFDAFYCFYGFGVDLSLSLYLSVRYAFGFFTSFCSFRISVFFLLTIFAFEIVSFHLIIVYFRVCVHLSKRITWNALIKFTHVNH